MPTVHVRVEKGFQEQDFVTFGKLRREIPFLGSEKHPAHLQLNVIKALMK